MSRLRWRTFTMSTATRSVVAPNSAPWRATYATCALQISFLLGMQLMFGHEPPIHWLSTTAVRRPDRARSQASSFPPCPLPSTSASYRSGAAICSLQARGASNLRLLTAGLARRFRRAVRGPGTSRVVYGAGAARGGRGLRGRNLDSEGVGDFDHRQSLDVAQDDGGPIVRRKLVDRRREHVPKLLLHRGVIDARRPVPDRTSV